MMFDLRPRLDCAGRSNSDDPGCRGVKTAAGVTLLTSSEPFSRALAFFLRRRTVRSALVDRGAVGVPRGRSLIQAVATVRWERYPDAKSLTSPRLRPHVRRRPVLSAA